MNEVKRTERGWAGHLCVSAYCRYHRNTLLEFEDKKIVVSTVGHYVNSEGKIDSIGFERWYETMCFEGMEENGYIEADIHKGISINQEWGIWGSTWQEVLDLFPLVDNQADKMHESIVAEMAEKIQKGDI